MKIYADTSFLVSLLYPGDSAHQGVRTFFRQQPGAEWVTTDWSHFETVNSLRQLCLKIPGPKPATVEGIKRLFKHWHERGAFIMVETDWVEAMTAAQELSAVAGSSLRMRSADVLHVALLEQINPGLFVTRDQDQHLLAISRAFNAQLLP